MSKNTLIDYVIGTPNIIRDILCLHVEDFDPIFSDVHNIITVTFKATSNTHVTNHTDNQESRKLNRWTTDKTQLFVENLDQNQLVDILELLSDQNSSTTEITNRITEALMSSAEKTLGYRNPTPLKFKNSDKECRIKKQTYNRAIKVLKYNKTPEAVRQKRKACSEYKAAVRKHTQAKNKRFQNRLRDMRTNDSRAYWRMLNTKTREKIGPTIDELKEHFVQLNEEATGNDDDIEENLNANKHDYNDAILNDAISEEEVLKASAKLRNNKAPGEDEVLNEFIKASMPHMVKQYVGLFNKILDTSTYPEAWSLGLIIPIYKKKGDKKDCNNYRGITLLSCLGKLFTTVLNERLKQYCDINEIIKENQTGFRANYSTTDHIFSLKSLIDIFFKNKLKTVLRLC